jgi:RNA recognition motif-containing protein
MSRLIVKNIPAQLTSESLRDHFARSDGPGGTLTDVKVARKRNGTARCFGFLGYRTEAEAATAQRWFDHTFVGSTRISVQVVNVRRISPYFYLQAIPLKYASSREQRMRQHQDPISDHVLTLRILDLTTVNLHR